MVSRDLQPFFYFATSWAGWPACAGWTVVQRHPHRAARRPGGGFHRRKETGLAFISPRGRHSRASSFVIALFVVGALAVGHLELGRPPSKRWCWSVWSRLSCGVSLVLGVTEVKPKGQQAAPKIAFKALASFHDLMVMWVCLTLATRPTLFLSSGRRIALSV